MINTQTLNSALSKTLDLQVIGAEYEATQLHGGTVGNVVLITGVAQILGANTIPFKVVLKITKKWKRYADPDSWRREYDLYASNLGEFFLESMKWPKCYHMEIDHDETRLWLEYIEGVSGLDLTGEMYERAAFELGRFQGKLYAQQPSDVLNITNLSKVDAMEKFYRHYKSWHVVYDYVRLDTCEIPKHLCDMIIAADENADEMFRLIKGLPVVLCHRDFWVTNIFHCSVAGHAKIMLIDWDTTGWGYLGEDIVSLIADEADVEHMVEYYQNCVPAYRRGFSEYADISQISNLYICERIVLHFGYRLVEWYLDAKTPKDKQQQVDTLQKIYDIWRYEDKSNPCR